MATAEEGPKRFGFVGLTTGETHTLLYRPASDADRISSGGVVTSTPMPTLEELLHRNQVAYTLLETSPESDAGSSIRSLVVVWWVLWLWAAVWGVLAGLAIALDEFFIHPTIGIAALLFELPLMATCTVWASERRLAAGSQSRG